MRGDSQTRAPRRAALIGLVLACAAGAALAQPALQYMERGNRSEGVRDTLVSGAHYAIHILGFQAARSWPAARPSQLKVRFYLEPGAKPYLTVREIHNQHYYWLDKVRPQSPWRQGASNVFAWPTGDVIARLPAPTLQPADLGVTVRLGRETPALRERIAPVVVFYGSVPPEISAYDIWLLTYVDARLNVVLRDRFGRPVRGLSPAKLPSVTGGEPFPLHWKPGQAPAGRYRLVLDGYAVETNERMELEVEFRHRP